MVLSLFRGFERFLGGGGDIFRVINFYFHVHGKILKGVKVSEIEIFSWLDRPGYFKRVKKDSDGVRVF